MNGSDEKGTIMNVRIPPSLASRLEEVPQERGFKNKSEFVRTAIRDALNPPEELSDDVLSEIANSREQVEEGETTPLAEIMKGSNDSPIEDQQKSFFSDIATEGSLGKLESLFTGTYKNGTTNLDVLAIGCGNAGSNTIHRLTNIGTGNIETLAVNTDREHLKHVNADTKLLIGTDLAQGMGAAGDPDIGKQAAQSAEESIKQVIGDTDIVFITAGLGGGTGTGTAPVIAELVSEMGALAIGLVSTPFNVEQARQHKAQEGIEQLRSKCDTVIIFDNNLLLEYIPNLPIGKAFSVMDQILAESMESLIGTFSENALVDIDFGDFKTVVQRGDVGGILIGEGSLDNPEHIIEQTLQHPLIIFDISSASKGLVQITGSEQMSLNEAEDIVEGVIHRMSDDASLVWGAQIDPKMGDKVRVMVMLTDLNYVNEKSLTYATSDEPSEDVELLSESIPLEGNELRA
ncbi:cell division protein FtsZ [Halanaeroarchaeum sulfurireducens]|nr:cell division protein FtsZ [Halanaeroarchaeum sulfurireducens]